jgi:hypothetical protein
MFMMKFLPLKCDFESGNANVSENSIHITVPKDVKIIEFFRPRKILAVLMAYLYAFNDQTDGIMKNAFSVSSFSVAKDPANT